TAKREEAGAKSETPSSRLRALSDELRALEARLREGGGKDKIARQHKQKKMTARERVVGLCDLHARFLEIGLLVAHDEYDGQAPGAGVVTGVGLVHGREVVVVANDATVKAGSWWPETIKKILRAQEIAMRCRIPIIYLVDSAGEPAVPGRSFSRTIRRSEDFLLQLHHAALSPRATV